jgi:ribose transport system substrate-binding protein
MRLKKHLGLATAAVLLALSLSACGSSSQGGGGGDGAMVIGLLAPVTSGTPYAESYISALTAKADDLGVDVKVYDANFSAATQASQAEELFAQRPDAVILNPVAADGAAPIIAKANALKIPISISNNQITPELMDKAVLYTGPPNKQQGSVGAELLAKAMNGRGNVVILAGTAGSSVVNDRDAGLREKLAEMAPGITVIASQPGDWDKVKSITAMTALLTKYGSGINGVYAMSDDMAVGAAQAIRNAGKDPKTIPIVGTGFSKSGQAGLRDGSLYGTIRQSARSDGEYAIEYIVKSQRGESVPKETYIPSEPITVANVDEFEPDWS